MSQDDLLKAIEKAATEIETLKTRLDQLERSNVMQRMLPTTNLLSHSFLTRSFAIFGHNFVAGLIIAIPFYILFGIFAVAIGVFR